MCIIAYVKPNHKITDATIKIMFKGNPDGAGIMYQKSPRDNVRIIKGFMNVDALIKAFREIPETYERAIHCRIATAGRVSVQCCHPFPVRSLADNMMQAKDETPVAFMHNGVISWCNPKGGMTSEYSDTMLFGKRILYPVRKQLDAKHIQDMIEHSICNSRLLVFRRGGAPLMFGDWKKDSNGVMYSNDHYKEYTYKYSGCYGGWNNSYGYSYYGSTTKSTTKSTTTKEVAKSPKQETYQTYPINCCGDCYHCYEDCEANETNPYAYVSYISILVPKSEANIAECYIDDTLYTNGFNLTEWEETEYDEENYEVIIEVEGLRDFPYYTKDIAGYDVLGVSYKGGDE